jgi:hypothetical protein
MSEMVDRKNFRERMPDGRWTYDVDEYLASWKAISGPICKKLGLVCIGFNPGFLFREATDPHSKGIDMPVWLAKRILDAIEEPARE